MAFLQNSTTRSFVFKVFKARLFSERHAANLFISLFESTSSPPEMSPTTVVSSVNLMIMLLCWIGGCNHKCRLHTEEANTHTREAVVLNMRIEER